PLPQEGIACAGRVDRLVHLSQPAVVGSVSGSDRRGIEKLPQALDAQEVAGEGVAVLLALYSLLGRHQRLKASIAAIDASEPLQGLVEGIHELLGKPVHLDRAATSSLRIGVSERGRDLGPKADVIHDQAVVLLLAGDR